MTLNEYQKKALTTCMGSCFNMSYMLLNLVGEVGEFASKVAKAIRKGSVAPKDFHIDLYKCQSASDAKALELELKKEAGDCAWQLVGVCSVFGWDFEEICQMNIDKLQERLKNGTIDGNGDGVTKEERL